MAGVERDRGGIDFTRIENLSPKEKLVSRVNVITISGPSGTGKTVVANILAGLLNMDVIKVGERIRQWVKEETGQDIIDFAERTPEQDQAVDKKTAEKIRNTILGNKKLIVEGKLAGWVCKNVLNEEFEGAKDPLSLKIYLDASKKVRPYRVWKREVKKNPNLTLEKATTATFKRDAEDQKAWALAHPELIDNNPQNPKLVDSNGKPVYDLVINTNKFSAEEVALNIIIKMLQRDLAYIGTPEPTPDEPSKEIDIFKAA